MEFEECVKTAGFAQPVTFVLTLNNKYYNCYNFYLFGAIVL